MQKNLPSFNFLLSNFSTTELLLHIENYQHPVTNQPNLLLALLDDSVKSFIAPKHLPDLYKSIELLASEFSSEQIYQWLFAVTKPNNSNACGLNYVFSHQQLAVFFTELFSTQHLLRRLIGNDELNFSKIISTANCHGLWDIIYHRFNDRQIKQLLTTNMQSNARSALDSGNYNILAKIIQYTQNPSAIELVTKNQLLIEANLLPKIMQNFLLEATMLYPKNKIFTIFKANSTLTPTLNNQATYVTNHDSPSNSSFRYT